MSTHVLPDAETLAADIAARLTARVASVQAEGRAPRVVLTGGTIAIAAYELLEAGAASWSDVEWWFGDERFVPEGHEDRNDRQAREAFLDRVGASPSLVHTMPAHGGDESVAEAADSYSATLPDGPFDVVLLGVGPDGHVASLFPDHPQVHETVRPCVEVLDSPKPPAQRTTLTLPVLNRTRAAWFIVSGDGKAGAVARARADEGTLDETPARGVRGQDETLWLLDEPAASAL